MCDICPCHQFCLGFEGLQKKLCSGLCIHLMRLCFVHAEKWQQKDFCAKVVHASFFSVLLENNVSNKRGLASGRHTFRIKEFQKNTCYVALLLSPAMPHARQNLAFLLRVSERQWFLCIGDECSGKLFVLLQNKWFMHLVLMCHAAFFQTSSV